jgi:hypothetical protein
MKKYIFLLSLFWAISVSTSAQNITRLEYSIDGFVAEGNGTALEIPGDTNELDTELNIDISGLESGIHTIHFRAMNENGVWSFAAERSFYIPEEPVTDGIVAVEYSIDEAVKEGDGNLIALSNSTNHLDSIFQLDISEFEPGIHNIYMRAKNKMGVWSLPAERTFVITESDTTKIENIYYRFYNDDSESTWMTASVDPARENVDSTIMLSIAALDLSENYTVELYAQNSKGVRGYSVFLEDLSLRQNNAPESLKEMLDLSMSVNQNLEISMDSLFQDADLAFGDSLAYMISISDNPDIFDFASWNYPGILSLTPAAGQNGNYTFWLKANDLALETDSIQVVLAVTGSTGIDDQPAETRFIIYPNPARDYLTIRRDDYLHNSYLLRLFNATGQLFIKKQVSESEHRLNLSEYPGGVYFIVLQNDEFTVRKSVVVE